MKIPRSYRIMRFFFRPRYSWAQVSFLVVACQYLSGGDILMFLGVLIGGVFITHGGEMYLIRETTRLMSPPEKPRTPR